MSQCSGFYDESEDMKLRQFAALNHLVRDNMSAAWPIVMDIMQLAPIVDPDNNYRGNYDALLCLASIDVVGSRLWTFHMCVCHGNTVNLLAVLRAYRLGIAGISKEAIDRAIDNEEGTLDFETIVRAVREALPSFNTVAVPAR